MEVLRLFVDQLTKNVKEAPGWVPLVVVCYLAVPLGDSVPGLGGYLHKYRAVLVPVLAWVLYALGDALDKAVFPRPEENRGWAWLASGALKGTRSSVKKALFLDAGYYDVCKALAVSAKRYDRSWIQLKNEAAKFVRSMVLPALVLALVMLFMGEWTWASSSLGVSAGSLFVYGRLKGSHMSDLYIEVKRLTDNREKYGTADLDNGARLFFWDGKLVCAATRSQDTSKAVSV